MIVYTIRYEGKLFKLAKGLFLEFYQEKNIFYCRNELLDILCWGDTQKECEDAFNFSFYTIYTIYYHTLNCNLDANGVKLKGLLYELIFSVSFNKNTFTLKDNNYEVYKMNIKNYESRI